MKELIKVVAKYDTDELTGGESYEVIGIHNTSVEVRANGEVTMPETQKYMIEIICDTGKPRFFMTYEFMDEVRILREIKLCIITDNSIVNKKNRKLSTSELLDLFSQKY